MYKEAKLTVVGAGPGDVELITLKAIKALQSKPRKAKQRNA